MPAPAPLVPLPLLSFHGWRQQLKPPPIGAILRLHCPYDARSTSCLSGKPNVNQILDKIIFSNLTIIDVFPLVLML